MSQDAELLRSYADSHSEDAFAELVRRHLNLVYFAALRSAGGDAHLAEDITQDVFTALARQAASLARHATLSGWLYTTTRNITAKAVRTEQRRKVREQEAQFMSEPSIESGATADWERLRPLLDGALDELNDSDREAVLLRCLEGRAFAEIGATLSVSEDAVRMRVERALDKLHVLLAKRGVTSTAAALATVLANQAAATAPAGLAASVVGAALSGAATAGAGSLAAVIAFMSASKIGLSVAAAGAVAISAVVYQSSHARTATGALADASRDRAALAARLSELEGGVKVAEKELVNREVALARQTVAKTTAPAAAELSPEALAALARNTKYQETFAALDRSDPELRNARLVRSRSTYMVQNRSLFQSLGFTPEQIEQALDYLVEQDRSRMERQAGAAIAGKANENPLPNFWAQFGPGVAERVAQFQTTRTASSFVNDLTAKMYFIDEPFTAQQAEQLVQIINDARPASSQRLNVRIQTAAQLFRRSLDWEKILAQAGTVLSPTQLQGLRGMAAQAQVDAQLAAAANESAAPKK